MVSHSRLIKGALACKEFNNPEGIETEEEWNEIRPWLRPVLLNIVKSKKVLLEGVTFKNSPSWCLHPLSCEHITINQVKVFNPWYSQNGDALDLESCKNALIINNILTPVMTLFALNPVKTKTDANAANLVKTSS